MPTCQPAMNRKTEICSTEMCHHPAVPHGVDYLVGTHIISHYDTLTHDMLHLIGIKK